MSERSDMTIVTIPTASAILSEADRPPSGLAPSPGGPVGNGPTDKVQSVGVVLEVMNVVVGELGGGVKVKGEVDEEDLLERSGLEVDGVDVDEIVVDEGLVVLLCPVPERVPNMETAKFWSRFCAATLTLSQRA